MAAVMAEPVGRRRTSAAVLELATVGYVVATGVVTMRNPVISSFGAASNLLAVLVLGAGAGLVAVGLVSSWRTQPPTRGRIAIALGVVWLAPEWMGWWDAPAGVRTAALLVTPFLLPILVHLVLDLTSASGRGPRTLVVTGYVAASTYAVAHGLLWDPFHDPRCWAWCTSDNQLLLLPRADLAGQFSRTWSWMMIAACVLVVVFAARWVVLAGRPARRSLGPPVVACAAAGVATAVRTSIGLVRTEDPGLATFRTIVALQALALCGVAAGIGWQMASDRRLSRALEHLADELGAAPPPGTLRTTLARLLGDPGLEVGYWLPEEARYVDEDGREVVVPPKPAATSLIERHGQPIALVIHAHPPADPAGVVTRIGAAARLAVDNERLRAKTLSQVQELRAAQARVVHEADAERVRLERNLHDGAQQRLLRTMHELQLARRQATSRGQAELVARLDSAIHATQETLDSLRQLARGIHPAVLSDAGLGAALETVGDEARVPLRLDVDLTDRPAAETELGIYVAIVELVDQAAREGADVVEVSLRMVGDDIVVRVEPVQRTPGSVIADRMGALGATVHLEGGVWQAVVPCA